jgi:hypothetical protein
MKEPQKLLKSYYIILSLYKNSISTMEALNHPMLISKVSSMRNLFWEQSQLLVNKIDAFLCILI